MVLARCTALRIDGLVPAVDAHLSPLGFGGAAMARYLEERFIGLGQVQHVAA